MPLPNRDWMDDALCAQVGGDAWFPDKGESVKDAKKVCRQCPVKAECLEENLRERFGVYGGLSERERRAVINERKQESGRAA